MRTGATRRKGCHDGGLEYESCRYMSSIKMEFLITAIHNSAQPRDLRIIIVHIRVVNRVVLMSMSRQSGQS